MAPRAAAISTGELPAFKSQPLTPYSLKYYFDPFTRPSQDGSKILIQVRGKMLPARFDFQEF